MSEVDTQRRSYFYSCSRVSYF